MNEIKRVRAAEQVQEMIQKREVAVDLLEDGAVRRKLLAELVELRKSGTPSIELAQRLTERPRTNGWPEPSVGRRNQPEAS